MPCQKIESSRLYACIDNSGGIKKAWIANYEDITAPIISTMSGKITTLNMVGAANYYEYQFKKDTAELKVDGDINSTNGTVGYKGDLKLKFYLNEQANFNQIETLVKNPASIIVEDVNGKYWMLGRERACDVSALSTQYGVNISDFNGSEITWSFSEKKLPTEILDLTVITAVI